jgi:hypothetical protein
LPPVTAEELLGSLAARRASVSSLRARARVHAGIRAVGTREAVLVRRPDAIRIDVLSPFGLALALGARSALLWAYPPAEGVRYEGPPTAANMARFVGAPVAVVDIVDVLLGVPPARTPVGAPEVATRDGEYRLTLPLEGGEQTISFAPGTLAVLRADERRLDGRALSVAFGDYRDGFPHDLHIRAPDAEARLTYEAVEPNADIDPALFAPPPAARVLPLEASSR